jgi:hypothetical protein
MKNLSYNSNAISLNPAEKINHFEINLNRKEKRELKGFFKTAMGTVYFVTLMYSLFVLLT